MSDFRLRNFPRPLNNIWIIKNRNSALHPGAYWKSFAEGVGALEVGPQTMGMFSYENFACMVSSNAKSKRKFFFGKTLAKIRKYFFGSFANWRRTNSLSMRLEILFVFPKDIEFPNDKCSSAERYWKRANSHAALAKVLLPHTSKLCAFIIEFIWQVCTWNYCERYLRYLRQLMARNCVFTSIKLRGSVYVNLWNDTRKRFHLA